MSNRVEGCPLDWIIRKLLMSSVRAASEIEKSQFSGA